MLSITVPYFSLHQIYESGQCCMWKRFVSEGGHRYVIPIVNHGWMVAKQQKDTLYFYCTSTNFFDDVFEYMDFGVDYRFINTRLRRVHPWTRKVAERTKGVHVLRQPMWHAILSILMARGTRLPSEARVRYNRVAALYGEPMTMSSGSGARYRFYSVPLAYDLKNAYEGLTAVLTPDLADAVSQAAQDFCDGWYGFSEVDMSYKQAQRYLAEFPYWLPDEREKLLAWGFHYGIAFPHSRWFDANLRRNMGCNVWEFVNKKLIPLYGYESAVSMYFQLAQVKEIKKNGSY